jgi:hypothetical protein
MLVYVCLNMYFGMRSMSFRGNSCCFLLRWLLSCLNCHRLSNKRFKFLHRTLRSRSFSLLSWMFRFKRLQTISTILIIRFPVLLFLDWMGFLFGNQWSDCTLNNLLRFEVNLFFMPILMFTFWFVFGLSVYWLGFMFFFMLFRFFMMLRCLLLVLELWVSLVCFMRRLMLVGLLFWFNLYCVWSFRDYDMSVLYLWFMFCLVFLMGRFSWLVFLNCFLSMFDRMFRKNLCRYFLSDFL